MEAANPIDLGDPVMEWHGVARALAALARLSDDRNVRRKYLKAARQLFGGSRIDFYHFNRGGQVRAYEINASTSNNPTYNTKMEKHVNAVWKQVQVTGALAYFGDGALANLGADTFARPRVADGLIDNTIVEFDEGGKKHMALFNHGHAYMASWWGGLVLGERESNSVGPLVITRTDFRPVPYTGVEMPGVIRGRSALDELLGASIANAVQNMLKAVRSRPKNMSIKNAIARSLGYAGTYGLMWDYDSRKWLSQRPLFGAATALDPMLNKELERIREKLGMKGLEDTRFLQLNGHDRFYALPGTRTEILLRLKRLAFRGLDLANTYRHFGGAFANEVVGNGVADVAVAAVAAGLTDAAGAPGEFVYPVTATLGDGVEVGGADLCILGSSCQGGSIYDVVPGDDVEAVEPGINQVDVADNFGVRMRGIFFDLTGRISAAEAAMEGEDALAQYQELQKLIEELLHTFKAFQIHADGSLKRLEAERMLRGQDQRMQLQEQLKNLVDIGSELAVLKGCAEYLGTGLVPEEPHISDRKMRHSVAYDHVDIGDGRKVPVMMIRVKEHNKNSRYVALPWDMDRAWWQRLHLDRRG